MSASSSVIELVVVGGVHFENTHLVNWTGIFIYVQVRDIKAGGWRFRASFGSFKVLDSSRKPIGHVV